MSDASLPTTLDGWLARLERQHPTEIELGLDRVAAVYQRLGIERPAEIVITVGGTNGKGSTVATLEVLLGERGLRVGCYTSPHLLHYSERIKIAGVPASDTEICAAFVAIEQARGDISLTYFETGTLAAFYLFARARVDVAVLEVGLGGRLDAVNIVDADIAVITSIDLDHQDWLGNTREQIALEKLGIARPGKPLLLGDPNPPQHMLDAIAERAVHCLRLGDEFAIEEDAADSSSSQWRYRGVGGAITLNDPGLPLPSVACALQALQLLDIPLPSRLRLDVPLAGRFDQRSWQGRTVILDVAHNPAAAQFLAHKLDRLRGADQANGQTRKYLAVVGVMKDKDWPGIVEPLRHCFDGWYLGAIAGNPRAAQPASLAELLYNGGLATQLADDIEQAFDAAIANSALGDVVVVFGSFFTVAPVYQRIGYQQLGYQQMGRNRV